jgi:hypothetical protein
MPNPRPNRLIGHCWQTMTNQIVIKCFGRANGLKNNLRDKASREGMGEREESGKRRLVNMGTFLQWGCPLEEC